MLNIGCNDLFIQVCPVIYVKRAHILHLSDSLCLCFFAVHCEMEHAFSHHAVHSELGSHLHINICS